MSLRTPSIEIACQQVMTEDASVFSLQWSDFPLAVTGDISPKDLLNRYCSYIRKCTLTLIRPIFLESGVEFRLAGSTLSLISFLPPVDGDGYSTLYICGGVLVQPRQCERGELRFGVEHSAESVRLSLQLSEFCPWILGNQSPSLLRFWLYRLTQAAIHRLVTVRFLTILYYELTGHSAKVRVIDINVKNGKPV